MIYRSIVIKISGKILEQKEDISSTISQLSGLFKAGILDKIVIIPGGGQKANFIRRMQDKIHFDEDLAHFMAIYAMNENGNSLHNRFPNIPIYTTLQQISDSKRVFCIFKPLDYLIAHDSLPHSWDITSDSISYFFASEISVDACILIKNVDGIFIGKERSLIREISTKTYKEYKNSHKLTESFPQKEPLKNSTPIDDYLLDLIDKHHIPCFILNGKNSTQAIVNFFDFNQNINKKYTKLHY